jgi:flagellum-specific ATP synthase
MPDGDGLTERLVAGLERYQARLNTTDHGIKVHGSLVRTVGLVMEARGIHVAIGERCFVESEAGRLLPAEVVGFDGGRVLLMVEGQADGLAPGARVIPAGRTMEVAVGPEFLGRVIDGSGLPIDGKGQIALPGGCRSSGRRSTRCVAPWLRSR